jgi:flagellar basal-body rod protein FlgG
MLRSLYTAASGMKAQQFNVDTISNNLANANTSGFKKIRPEFQDLLYLTIRQPVAPEEAGAAGSPLGLFIGLGVKSSGSQTIFEQGNLTPTGNPLDLAISGDGFFTVSQDDSGGVVFYTRDGSFKLDGNGNLVTSDGYFVLDDSGSSITLDSTQSIDIARDGTISNGTETSVLGIVQFPNPAGLERVGHNLYSATAAAGEIIEPDEENPGYTVEQQYLESSNVQVVDEMVNLITAQRAYEINSKAITASDEMLSIAGNLKK